MLHSSFFANNATSIGGLGSYRDLLGGELMV